MTRIFSILWNVCINHVPVALTVSWTITRLMISSNTILDLNTLCSSGCLLSRSARALKSYAKLIAATQAACHESRGMRINFIGCRKSLLIIWKSVLPYLKGLNTRMCCLSYVLRSPSEIQVRWAAREKPEDDPEVHVHGRFLFESNCSNKYFPFLQSNKLWFMGCIRQACQAKEVCI